MAADDALRERLAARWDHLFRDAEPAARRAVRTSLFDAYDAPGRHYHDLRHVAQMLEELDGVRPHCAAPDAVEAAVWFHDCVYDPTRGDNEERSADEAAGALVQLGRDGSIVANVALLILATKHKEVPATPDERLLVDVDLSILGKPAAQFDAYEEAVRREYAHVEDAAFRRGRAGILRAFLARPKIYSTDVFADRYEAAARANLARSLARLA